MQSVVHITFATICVAVGMTLVESKGVPAVNDWGLPSFNEHLGGEYDCIARAIRDDRGYADPFEVKSGPTAWMPPALPTILAGFYWLTGDNRANVVEIVLVLKGLVLVFSGALVCSEAARLRLHLSCLVFPLMLVAGFLHYFQVTHDEWWLLLLVNLLWLGSIKLWIPALKTWRRLDWRPTQLSNFRIASIWGVFGGITALSSPILGAAWAVLSTGLVARNRMHCGIWPVVAIALVSMAVVAPWTIRNRVVLGALMPIKSNGAFELWQSQCLSRYGVVDAEVTQEHPYTPNSSARRRYLQVGEIAFVNEKWPEIRESLAHEPLDYAWRVCNRASAALICFWPYAESFDGSQWPSHVARWTHAWPLIAFAVIVCLNGMHRKDDRIVVTLVLFAVVLIPYILISYYARYAAPLLVIKCLLILYGVNVVRRGLGRRV